MKNNFIPDILDIMAVCIGVIIVCPVAIVFYDSITDGVQFLVSRFFFAVSVLSLVTCVGISIFVRVVLDVIVERAIEAFPTISLQMLIGTLSLLLLVTVLLILFFAIWLSDEGGHLLTFGSCFLITYIICSAIWSLDKSMSGW